MGAVFFSLGRDDAKGLFGSRDRESLIQFVSETCSQKSVGDNLVRVQTNWRDFKSSFNELDNDGLLDHVTDGSRPLLQEEDQSVYVVRPDLVAHISDKLTAISDLTLDNDAICTAIQDLTSLYQNAKENRMCIVFTTGVVD